MIAIDDRDHFAFCEPPFFEKSPRQGLDCRPMLRKDRHIKAAISTLESAKILFQNI
jgi:hypothetical protein